MISVTVGDYCLVNGLHRVDIKIAGFTVEPFSRWKQEPFWLNHDFKFQRRTQSRFINYLFTFDKSRYPMTGGTKLLHGVVIDGVFGAAVDLQRLAFGLFCPA